jgi:hypothetical protein
MMWSRENPHYDYVVYFYQSGRFESYIQRQRDLLAVTSYGLRGMYDFTSDLVGKPRFYKPQSVEEIITSGYLAVPKSDLAEAIISDRKRTAWLGLDDIIGQIRQRYEVYEKNIYDLEIAKCAVINTFYTHEAWHGPSTTKLEYSVNKRLDKLYNDQREERIELWRDVSRLKLLLPEQAQKYLTSYRKVSILEDSKGDVP